MVLLQPGHRAGAQSQDHRPRLLARRVLLSGAAVAGGRRADLEMDPAARRRAQCRARRRRRHAASSGWPSRLGVLLGRSSSAIWAHMGFYTLILLAGCRRFRRTCTRRREMDARRRGARCSRITLPLLMPNLLVVLRAGADPRGADLRRGLRADRRRTGIGDDVHRAVHLPDRLRGPGRSCMGWPPRLRCVLALVLMVLTLDPAARPPTPASAARNARDERLLAFLTRTRGRGASTGPTGSPTPTSCVGLFLMFGPVLWLVMSSFKTEAALTNFRRRFLPYGQKTVAVPGEERLKPLYRVTMPDGHGTRELAQSAPHRPDGARWSTRRSPSEQIRVNINDREPVREFAFATENYTELVRQASISGATSGTRLHHRRGHDHHAAVQLDGRVRAVEVPVHAASNGRVPADHRHADDPADHHAGADLSGGHRTRAAQQPVGRDLAGGRDADRRVPAAPVHADDPRRAARRRAHGPRQRVAHLLAHRAAAGGAGAGGAGDLLGHVALERLPVAADRADRNRAVHAAARAQFVPGRTQTRSGTTCWR